MPGGRSLKRRLANHLWRPMIAERRHPARANGPDPRLDHTQRNPGTRRASGPLHRSNIDPTQQHILRCVTATARPAGPPEREPPLLPQGRQYRSACITARRHANNTHDRRCGLRCKAAVTWDRSTVVRGWSRGTQSGRRSRTSRPAGRRRGQDLDAVEDGRSSPVVSPRPVPSQLLPEHRGSRSHRQAVPAPHRRVTQRPTPPRRVGSPYRSPPRHPQVDGQGRGDGDGVEWLQPGPRTPPCASPPASRRQRRPVLLVAGAVTGDTQHHPPASGAPVLTLPAPGMATGSSD